jgi:tyramine---L-glutamate ligase
MQEGDQMIEPLLRDILNKTHKRVILTRNIALPSSSMSFLSKAASEFPDRIEVAWVKEHEDLTIKTQSLANRCDLAVVIAPEIDNALFKTVQSLRKQGFNLWNASEAFITMTSDKLLTYKVWEQAKIRQPVTLEVDFDHLNDNENRDKTLRDMDRFLAANDRDTKASTRFCMKPVDGAGGNGLRLFSSFEKATKWMRRKEACGRYLLQPWIEGIAGSICCAITDEAFLPWQEADSAPRSYLGAHESATRWHWFPAMRQILGIIDNQDNVGDSGATLSYLRSEPCWDRPVQEVIQSWARKVLQSIPSRPYGWIGIDFVCDGPPELESSFVAVEINPRMTSSYVYVRDRL